MLRGGAFNNNRQNVRCAYRNRNNPNNRNRNIGFRVVSHGFPLEFRAGHGLRGEEEGRCSRFPAASEQASACSGRAYIEAARALPDPGSTAGLARVNLT